MSIFVYDGPTMSKDKSTLKLNLTRRDALKQLGAGATAPVAAEQLDSAEVPSPSTALPQTCWWLALVSPG